MSIEDSESATAPFARALQRVVDVHADELRALLWSCAYFFCLLTCFFILRPLREQMGTSVGSDKLPTLFTGTLIGMLIVNPIFAWIATRYPRRAFIPWVYRFCILCLIAFYALLQLLPEASSTWVKYLFFAWVSVFNLLTISIFWSFMADLFDLKQGKRLFGFIGVGGTLGAIAGSSLTAFFAREIGPVNLVLVAAVFLEGSVQTVRVLVRVCRVQDEFAKQPASTPAVSAVASHVPQRLEDIQHGSVFTGFRLVFQSPYLLGICLYTFLYTLSSTFMYFEQQHIVQDAIQDTGARTEFFGRIDLAVNVITVLVQAFLTGRIVAKLGVGFALISQPVLAVAAFTALGLSPVLWVVAVFQVLLRACNNATAKPSREMLFTVVGREVKYKSKSFIDTLVYRTGDQLAAWSFPLVQRAVGLGLSGVAFAAIPLSLAWIVTGTRLGRLQKKIAAHGPKSLDDANGEPLPSRVQA